jgi:hypothetical protein
VQRPTAKGQCNDGLNAKAKREMSRAGNRLTSMNMNGPRSPEQLAVLNQLAEAKGRAVTDAEVALILPQLAVLSGIRRGSKQKVALQDMRGHIDELCSTHDLITTRVS